MRMKKNNLDDSKIFVNQAGFTILEFVVSLSIIVMLSALYVSNYRSPNRQNILMSAAQQVLGDIRLVQSYALASKKNGSAVPTGGWGIYFCNTNIPPCKDNQYIIFADDGTSPERLDSNDSYQKAVLLPGNGNVVIDNVSGGVSLNGESQSEVSMVFLPPDPTTFLEPESGPISINNNAQIRLKDKATNSTKTVFINFYGMVEIQ